MLGKQLNLNGCMCGFEAFALKSQTAAELRRCRKEKELEQRRTAPCIKRADKVDKVDFILV